VHQCSPSDHFRRRNRFMLGHLLRVTCLLKELWKRAHRKTTERRPNSHPRPIAELPIPGGKLIKIACQRNQICTMYLEWQYRCLRGENLGQWAISVDVPTHTADEHAMSASRANRGLPGSGIRPEGRRPYGRLMAGVSDRWAPCSSAVQQPLLVTEARGLGPFFVSTIELGAMRLAGLLEKTQL
jgi:hypothetical protein